MPNFNGSWGQCDAYYQSFCTSALPIVNAGFDEFFGRFNNGLADGFISNDIAALENATSTNKQFSANLYPGSSAVATETSLAAYLVGNKTDLATVPASGNAPSPVKMPYFGWNGGDSFSEPLLAKARSLGNPTAARYTETSTTVWRRNYQRGYVRVNVGASTSGGLSAYTGQIVSTP